ncbi:hypothetical protein ACFVS2_20970 [Brevibacillus sp. NPDC058079]|uniref:hypothetical protein n=1 Tax=Brevibacillus sp. NPDC058079 TaxID=3346330 RepID=UPI0036EB20D3
MFVRDVQMKDVPALDHSWFLRSGDGEYVLNNEVIKVNPCCIKKAKRNYHVATIEVKGKLKFDLWFFFSSYGDHTLSARIFQNYVERFQRYTKREQRRLLIMGVYTFFKHIIPNEKYTVWKSENEYIGSYFILEKSKQTNSI